MPSSFNTEVRPINPFCLLHFGCSMVLTFSLKIVFQSPLYEARTAILKYIEFDYIPIMERFGPKIQTKFLEIASKVSYILRRNNVMKIIQAVLENHNFSTGGNSIFTSALYMDNFHKEGFCRSNGGRLGLVRPSDKSSHLTIIGPTKRFKI